jgi:hypothetical protein
MLLRRPIPHSVKQTKTKRTAKILCQWTALTGNATITHPGARASCPWPAPTSLPMTCRCRCCRPMHQLSVAACGRCLNCRSLHRMVDRSISCRCHGLGCRRRCRGCHSQDAGNCQRNVNEGAAAVAVVAAPLGRSSSRRCQPCLHAPPASREVVVVAKPPATHDAGARLSSWRPCCPGCCSTASSAVVCRDQACRDGDGQARREGDGDHRHGSHDFYFFAAQTNKLRQNVAQQMSSI